MLANIETIVLWFWWWQPLAGWHDPTERQDLPSEFEWGQHYQHALDSGWSEQDCERVKIGPEADGWNEWGRAL